MRMRATIKIMAVHSQQKNHVTRNLVRPVVNRDSVVVRVDVRLSVS